MKTLKLAMMFLMLAVSVSLSACGGDKDKDKDTAKANKDKTPPVDPNKDKDKGISSKSAKDKLVGTWAATMEIDEEKMKTLMSGFGAAQEEIDKAIADAKKEPMKITIVLNADGTSKATTQEGSHPAEDDAGKWEVVSEKGNVATVKLTDDKDETKEAKLTFDGDDSFTFEMEEMEEMPIKTPVFERQ